MKFADVKEIYNKYKELKREDIKNLQEWSQKQPHLPIITELEHTMFLHSCNYSMELAKTTTDKFYTYKTHCPEFFANVNLADKSLKLALDTIFFMELPDFTPEGYKIIFSKLTSLDPNDYTFSDHVKIFDMCMMQWLHEEGPAEGIVIVIDTAGLSFGHLLKIHIMMMKKGLMYLQEALPVRLKSIHFINVGSIMDSLMALMKPFLKKEVADNFHFHEVNSDKVYNYLPKEYFPKDYGGNIEPVAALHETMKRRFNENKSFFMENEKLVVNESKRQGKPRNADDIFGVEGSFKKLDID